MLNFKVEKIEKYSGIYAQVEIGGEITWFRMKLCY
jgi:hypothetical protein